MLKTSAKVSEARYIVWLDYGSEGWRPICCTTLEEVLFVETYDHEFVVTEVIPARVSLESRKAQDDH